MVGTGGVGKTTISASIAIKAAQMGKKTIVLTIDPAKRLAQALGLRQFDYKPQKVSFEKDVELFAMMLDTRHTFDSLIQKYAPHDVCQKILNNRIYQHLASLMAATQEYMALEKLYELNQENSYDLIVLDTPPAQHALSFLQASDHLSNFLDENILKWFLIPRLKFFFSGSHAIFKIIERLTGFELLKDFSEFLMNFQTLYGGFRERTLKAKDILRNPDTVFFLITDPDKNVFNKAKEFYKNLDNLHIHMGGVLINRVIQEVHLSTKEKKDFAYLNSSAEEKALLTLFEQYQDLASHEKKHIQEFKQSFSPNTSFTEIPFFEEGMSDIKGLKFLNLHLFQ